MMVPKMLLMMMLMLAMSMAMMRTKKKKLLSIDSSMSVELNGYHLGPLAMHLDPRGWVCVLDHLQNSNQVEPLHQGDVGEKGVETQ